MAPVKIRDVNEGTRRGSCQVMSAHVRGQGIGTSKGCLSVACLSRKFVEFQIPHAQFADKDKASVNASVDWRVCLAPPRESHQAILISPERV
jgi:hypothetical protein